MTEDFYCRMSCYFGALSALLNGWPFRTRFTRFLLVSIRFLLVSTRFYSFLVDSSRFYWIHYLPDAISRTFVKKLDEYTGSKYVFKIIWNTRNIRSLFPLKDRVDHRSCVIYQGTCSCGEDYIGRRSVLRAFGGGSIPIQHPQRSLPTQHATSSRTQHTPSHGKFLRVHLDKI